MEKMTPRTCSKTFRVKVECRGQGREASTIDMGPRQGQEADFPSHYPLPTLHEKDHKLWSSPRLVKVALSLPQTQKYWLPKCMDTTSNTMGKTTDRGGLHRPIEWSWMSLSINAYVISFTRSRHNHDHDHGPWSSPWIVGRSVVLPWPCAVLDIKR